MAFYFSEREDYYINAFNKDLISNEEVYTYHLPKQHVSSYMRLVKSMTALVAVSFSLNAGYVIYTSLYNHNLSELSVAFVNFIGTCSIFIIVIRNMLLKVEKIPLSTLKADKKKSVLYYLYLTSVFINLMFSIILMDWYNKGLGLFLFILSGSIAFFFFRGFLWVRKLN